MKRTIRVERWLSVAAGVVYLSVPTPLVAAPEWSASQVIGPPTASEARASVVGVDGDGDIVLAWRTPGPGLDLLDAVRAGATVPVRWAVRPSGGTFTVDPAPAFESPCCVGGGLGMAVSARGDVLLRSTWLAANMEFFGFIPRALLSGARALRPSGGDFQPLSLSVPADALGFSYSAVFEPSGALLAAWSDPTSATAGRVRWARRSPDGVEVEGRPFSTPGRTSEPGIAVDPFGGSILTWDTATGGRWAYRPEGGAFPATGAQLSSGSPSAYGGSPPRVWFDAEGNAIAVWTESAAGPARPDGTRLSQLMWSYRPAGYTFPSEGQPLGPPGEAAEVRDVVFWGINSVAILWMRSPAPEPSVPELRWAIGATFGAYRPMDALLSRHLRSTGGLAVDPDRGPIATWLEGPPVQGASQAVVATGSVEPGSLRTSVLGNANAAQVPLVRVDRVGNVVLAWTKAQGIGVEIRPAGARAFQAIEPPTNFGEYPTVQHLEFDHEGNAVMVGGEDLGGQRVLRWSTLKFPGSAEAQPPIAPGPLVKVRVPTRLVSVRVHRRSPRWFSVRVTCSTSAFGDCKGSVKLIQRVGRSPRGSIVLGSALVRRLPAGHSVTLRIRIRRVAAAASRPGPIAAVASISDTRGKVRVTRGAVPSR